MYDFILEKILRLVYGAFYLAIFFIKIDFFTDSSTKTNLIYKE